jgi:hypothetical protein
MAEERYEPEEASEPEEARGRDDRPRQRFDAFIPDMLRRTFYAGLGAIFTSEEGLRRMAQDFSLPKDAANYLINQAQSTKNELFRVFATEIRRFFEDLRLNEELQRLLSSMSIELNMQVRFIPNDDQLRPVVDKQRVRVKRKRRGKRHGASDSESDLDAVVESEPPEPPAKDEDGDAPQ